MYNQDTLNFQQKKLQYFDFRCHNNNICLISSMTLEQIWSRAEHSTGSFFNLHTDLMKGLFKDLEPIQHWESKGLNKQVSKAMLLHI